MEPVERLTYELLLNYAFTLHENPASVTDEEIQRARDFADEYLKDNPMPNNKTLEMRGFINKQVIEATSGSEYENLLDHIVKLVLDPNDENLLLHLYLDANDLDKIIVKKIHIVFTNDINFNVTDIERYSYDIVTGKIKPFEGKLNYKDYLYLDTKSVKKEIPIGI